MEAKNFDIFNVISDIRKNGQAVISVEGINITLRKGVFIPDYKMFQLINTAIRFIEKNKTILTIGDIGTGSGVIAVLIAKRFPNKKIFAYETSAKAIELARYNTSKNNIKNVRFFNNKRGSWSNPPYKKIDFIISNPPYLGNLEYASKNIFKKYPDLKYQPKMAIRSYDKYGILPFVKILNGAIRHQTKYILFRSNADFVDKTVQTLQKIPHKIKIKKIRDGIIFAELK